MCDRPKPQAALASSLGSLPALLPDATRIPFIRAFWLTMAREWTNIDVLRMEKFLLLTRRYVGAMLAACKESAWSNKVVEGMMELLEEVPMEATNNRLPNGMRYHVIDIYVDELERVGALEEEEEEKGIDLEKLLGPLRRLGKESPTKGVRTKCKEALEDERLPGNKKEAESNQDEDKDATDEGEWVGIDD